MWSAECGMWKEKIDGGRPEAEAEKHPPTRPGSLPPALKLGWAGRRTGRRGWCVVGGGLGMGKGRGILLRSCRSYTSYAGGASFGVQAEDGRACPVAVRNTKVRADAGCRT